MTEIETLQARIAELEDHLSTVLKLCDHANKGAFENGVKSECGLDEGDVIAGHIIESARAALSFTPPVAVWPRVFRDTLADVRVFDEANHVGVLYADGFRNYGVSGRRLSTCIERDKELHGPEKAAMLAKLGLDENGKAIKKDGV